MAVNDTFDQHAGNLIGYSTGPITTVLPDRRHYDLRSFTGGGRIIPWTMLQMELWNYQHFAPYTMLQLETGEAASGTSEGWTNATQVGPDATYRYSNTIRRSVAVGTPQTVTSTFKDDIFTDLSNAAYIELVLRDFPAQAAAVRLDLANSFIDFTSDNYGPKTDSIRFNQSLNSLTAGGNLTFRINRNLLVNSTLTNITGVRFRLTAAGTGTMTFIASAMRVIPQTGYLYREIDIDTKQQALTRSVPVAGGSEPASTFGTIYFNTGAPIDTEYYAKFFNGNNPVGNDNRIALAFRYSDTDQDHWRVTLSSRSTQSRLSIDHWDGSSLSNFYATPINTNILTQNKSYFLKVELAGDRIKTGIYKAIGGLIGDLVYETPSVQLSEDIRPGYIGYSFEPYNYDFTLDYVGSALEQYGYFESTVFESNSYVKAATLTGFASKDIEVYPDNALTSLGDVVTSSFGETSEITRSGNLWYGGMKTTTPANISDSRSAVISGEIFSVSAPRGDYRLVLTDSYGQVVWRSIMAPIARNQWREFEILIGKNLMPDKYNLEIHQAGFYPDSFMIRNLNITLDSIDWWASNDAGITYYPFLNSIDYEFAGLNFPNLGNQLQVKALLKQADGWIQGYRLKPIYQMGGHELWA